MPATINYHEVLLDLKERKTDLEAAIRAVTQILFPERRGAHQQNSVDLTPPPREREGVPALTAAKPHLKKDARSLPEIVIDHLQSIYPQSANAREISDATGYTTIKSLFGTLSRLTSEGKLEKMERGKYRAKGRS